jgi:small subunit ribosomal protein S20
MANTESAKKRVRQNVKRRALNRWRLRSMRTAIKSFDKAIADGQLDAAADAFKTASAVVDKTAQKGVIHRNQAARRKSRMSARLKKAKQGACRASAIRLRWPPGRARQSRGTTTRGAPLRRGPRATPTAPVDPLHILSLSSRSSPVL